MPIIDTHCHINDEALYPIAEEVVSRAKEAGVVRVFNAGDSLESFGRILELKNRFPGFCEAVLGIHPEFATKSRSYLEEAYKQIEENKNNIKAIGEIGLDYHYDKSEETKAKQKEVFIEQIRLAKKLNLPIVIHARDADYDTFSIVKEELPDKVDLHCYSGSWELLKEYLRLPIQLYIGVGGVSTFKNARVIKEVVAKAPKEILMTETDSPYLAPTPHRGERNEPSYLPLVVKQIAELRNEPVEEAEENLYENGRRFYGIE